MAARRDKVAKCDSPTSGFIGLHTTLRLLQLGYTVRGKVRTEAHEKNIRQTLSKYLDPSKLESARTDLLKDKGWHKAIQGYAFVIHTTSQYPAENPKD